jgi:hypothetical protein
MVLLKLKNCELHLINWRALEKKRLDRTTEGQKEQKADILDQQRQTDRHPSKSTASLFHRPIIPLRCLSFLKGLSLHSPIEPPQARRTLSLLGGGHLQQRLIPI